MGWLWGWVWFWLHNSHLERAIPFWVMKKARLSSSWWLFGKLCFSICVSCRLFAIWVSSMFGPWVFVVAVISWFVGCFLGFVFSCGGYYVFGFWVEFSYACLFVSWLFFGFVLVAFFYFVNVCCAVFLWWMVVFGMLYFTLYSYIVH
jgi:hypothetical protein